MILQNTIKEQMTGLQIQIILKDLLKGSLERRMPWFLV